MPETWISVLLGIIGGIAISAWARKAKVKRRRLLLEAIRKLEPNASTLAIGQEVEGEFHPGWIYSELDSMREEGMLIMCSKTGGPERGFRDRVFYSITRKALEETK